MHVCAVHICEVPLEDILRTSNLIANKASVEVSKEAKPADVLKDADRIAAMSANVDNDKVDRKLVKPRKSRLSADKIVVDADDKRIRRNSSGDKIRRQRQRSTELQGDGFGSDKISSSASPASGSTLINTELTAKVTVPEKVRKRRRRQQQHSEESQGGGLHSDKISSLASSASQSVSLISAEQVGKNMISEKEHKRRRSRQSVEVTNIVTAQPPKYLVGDHLRYGSGMTYPPGDVSYGSEAMEDVIQRLLDNDELMDDVHHGATPAVDSFDTKRKREVPKKSGKSPRSTGPQPVNSQPHVKSPRPVGHTTITSQASAKLPASTSEMSVKSPKYVKS